MISSYKAHLVQLELDIIEEHKVKNHRKVLGLFYITIEYCHAANRIGRYNGKMVYIFLKY